MCLLVLGWRVHPRYRLVLAANRDEYHERPAAPLGKWEAPAGMIAGRDLRAGGTWLGVDARSRLGVVTNFRDLQKPRPGAPSRGALIPAYLGRAGGTRDFLDALTPGASEYSGFNLLICDSDSLAYASNRAEPFARTLMPGIYGLSNQLLDMPWPKLVRVRRRFDQWMQAPAAASERSLFAMLDDREPAAPEAGSSPSPLPPDLQRALSAPFVHHPIYGTRCSTVVLIEHTGALRIAERRFDDGGNLVDETAFELPSA